MPNIRTIARHIICVAALMWTGLINGQPFFFPDTSNYIRAADSAVYMASGKTISTAWTDRYRNSLSSDKRPATPGTPAPATTTNDIPAGIIMSGRSPYIGALMYLGYVLGDFWPFVLLQAIIAYALIVLSLQRFEVGQPRNILLVTLLLALTTSLPTYNSLLLADAFAGFGILAYLLIATPGRLTRVQTAFLVLVVIMSVISHLTHIMMMIGMVAVLVLMRGLKWPVPRRAWVVGVGAILLGFLSVQLTSVVTRLAFGQPPRLLPLLTARFYDDGPGKAFIRSGCDGQRFQVCRIHMGNPSNNTFFLFSTRPSDGAYLLATPPERLRMGEEDVAFALAVIRYDPMGELGMMLSNWTKQALWIDYDGLNTGCFDGPGCWESLPPRVREQLRQSPSGRRIWPTEAMNALLYVVVIASLLSLFVTIPSLTRRDPESAGGLRTWLLVGGAAMAVCDFFGGAVAEPQYRYQGRIIWLVVLIAVIALLSYRKAMAKRTVPPGEAMEGAYEGAIA